MENTIDRKEYRRNSCSVHEKTKIVTKKKESLFLNQIINSLLLFLFVLLLKFFGFQNQFELVKENFNNGISYEVFCENLILNAKAIIDNFFYDEDLKNENIVTTSGDETFSGEEFSGDKKEEELLTKIDGINQLIDDAENIKKNFDIVSPLNGTITSKFGVRESENPIVSSYHAGLDIGANTGTIIVASHDGSVIKAGDNGTYGKCVILQSGDLKTVYAHCSAILIKEGMSVKKGDQIAKVGMTGNATGPHLHFEIRYQDRFVNPEDVIKNEE